MISPASAVALLAALAATTSAHTEVKTWTIGGQTYAGFRDEYKTDPGNGSPAWLTNQGWGHTPIYGSAMNSEDIICHEQAVSSKHSAPAAAGSSVSMEWYHIGAPKGACPKENQDEEGWDCSHHGFTATYMAPCYGPCADVDKTSLKFFKISEKGLIDFEGRYKETGRWGTDVTMYENGNVNTVTIPGNIPSGEYVFRTEVWSFHNSGDGNVAEAQAWPQCANIKVTGGDDSAGMPEGKPAMKLYSPKDPMMMYNIYLAGHATEVPVPGPPMFNAGSGNTKARRAHRSHSRAFSS